MTQNNRAPAERLEDVFHLFPKTFVHDAVEALAVIIDDPPRIAQVVLPAFLQALIDIALIKLGVTHERDHAAQWPVCRPGFGFKIVLYD